MRFQVPQFIDVEDKIIGPFTLKQFLIYFSAVLILIPIFLLSDLSLFITLALPTAGVAALFAHYRLHGKTLATVIGNAFGFYSRGVLFIWQRTGREKPLIIKDAAWEAEVTNPEFSEESLTSLTSMSQSLETQGNVVRSEDVEDPLVEESLGKHAS
jgi:hypothetical protein